MIHSMAGGKIGKLEYNDFAKVRILEGEEAGKAFFYITKIFGLKAGDKVLVPVGNLNTLTMGEVERIDKGVSSQNMPIALKKCKSVEKRL